jgi:hypothetical protein
MKPTIKKTNLPLCFWWIAPVCVLFSLGVPTARAGLTVDIHLYHDTYGYYFYPWLNANTNLPDFPTGNYEIASPQIPTGGSQLQYQATNNMLNYTGGGGNYYGDFNSFLFGITNGQWSIFVTNSTSTNQYQFTVTVTGVTSNSFSAPAVALFPTNGAMNITSQPLFLWTGPTNWAGTLNVSDYFIDTNGIDTNVNYNYEASTGLSPNQTSWPCPVVLPNGTNDFSADYVSNVTAQIVAAIPTNGAAQPISGWISTATLETHFTFDSQFTVGSSGGTLSGHTLIAHYAFDNSGNLGQDSSGNGNDMTGESYWGPQHQFDTDAEAGGGAVQFFGTDAINPSGQALTNLNAVLAGSFTFSTWVKTTVTNGADYNNAFFGAVIFWAYNDHSNTNDTIPLAITGSKAAFTTRGGDSGVSDTLHSLTSVNDGNYHLITVTRDQGTGEKKIYVDGNLDNSQIGTTNPLNGNNYNLTIGGWDYYIDGTGTNYSSYNGLLDDLQIYSGVLSATEVAEIYTNPGTTIPNITGNAANGLVAYYDFDEGNVVAPDISGNGNNIVLAGNFGGSGPVISSDAVAGAGSVSFDGGSYLSAPASLLSTLAGSFTISLWVNTTQYFDYQGDYAYNGAGIISADVPGLANDLVPVALTGGQVAFNTGNPQGGYDDTINSSATVNDGSWHHVVVCRNQGTGEKDIYIDGSLDTHDFDTTALLSDPVLLTIGAIADASNPDPSSPTETGYNGYQGLLDDIQIYDRVLNTNEITFLYNNPGSTVGVSSNTPYPVDVSLQLTIVRAQDPNLGEYFDAGVSFNSVNPAPSTTNSVQSPNNYYSTEQYPSGGYGSSEISSSLGDVLNECTNGFWKIYINQGSPTQEVYSFQVSISGLDTNLLSAVTVFSPTNNAVNVATNPVYYWSGPSNYSTLVVDLLSGPVASLPVTATNWPTAPALNYGTNRFDVSYNSNNFPGVTFTTPVDVYSNPIETWNTTVTLNSVVFQPFVVGAPAPLPVLLTNLTRSGGNLAFSFETLAGRPHTVQSRTNLTGGTWINLTNFVGDGSLKQLAFPATNPPVQFFRVLTQ